MRICDLGGPSGKGLAAADSWRWLNFYPVPGGVMSVKHTLSPGPHVEQLRKLRHREGKLLARGHPASKCQSWDLNLGALAP